MEQESDRMIVAASVVMWTLHGSREKTVSLLICNPALICGQELMAAQKKLSSITHLRVSGPLRSRHTCHAGSSFI